MESAWENRLRAVVGYVPSEPAPVVPLRPGEETTDEFLLVGCGVVGQTSFFNLSCADPEPGSVMFELTASGAAWYEWELTEGQTLINIDYVAQFTVDYGSGEVSVTVWDPLLATLPISLFVTYRRSTRP